MGAGGAGGGSAEEEEVVAAAGEGGVGEEEAEDAEAGEVCCWMEVYRTAGGADAHTVLALVKILSTSGRIGDPGWCQECLATCSHCQEERAE